MALTAELTIVSVDSVSSKIGRYRVQAQVSVNEDDVNLLPEVFGTINWGDGVVEPVDVGQTNLIYSSKTMLVYNPTLEGSIYHDYQSGQFNIQLIGSNLKSPTRETVSVYDSVKLSSQVSQNPASPVIIGPILPADGGFPNSAQWILNTDTDLRLLASNVKMILLTNVGERLMIPNYGTMLRQILFSPVDSGVEAAAAAEIRRAISAWEPRVTVQDLSIVRSQTSANITLTLVSQLSKQPFNVALAYQNLG